MDSTTTLIAAVASAIAALGSLIVAALAWSTGRMQTRAYVELDDVHFSGLAAGAAPLVEIVLRNGGQTPAIDLISSIEAALHAPGTVLQIDAPDEKASVRNILPGRDTLMGAQFPRELTETDIIALEKGHAVFEVWGTIDYTDVFRCKRTSSYVLRCPAEVGGDLSVIAIRRSPGSFPVRQE